MHTEAALARLRDGDVGSALALLETAPTDGAPRQAALGVALLAADRPAEALKALLDAVRSGDASPLTLLNLAIAEDRAGDPHRARQLMRGLEQRLPDWDEPPLRIAESLRAHGDPAGAEAAYRRVLDLNPCREEALVALAGLLIARGAAPEAQALLLRCCGIAPRRAEAWDTLGIALLQIGDPALARTAFCEAFRHAPDRLDYALHRVDAAIQVGDAEAELVRLHLDCDAEPLNPALHCAKGVLHEHLGQRSEAIESFETAVALAPDAPAPTQFLGQTLTRTARLREAEAALRRAVALNPGDATLRNDLAATLMRMHRHGEARTLLQSALDEYGEDARLVANLANTTCCLGLQDEAVALARRAVALAPAALNPRRSLLSALVYCDGIPGSEVTAAARACADHTPRVAQAPLTNTPDPDRKLVVGLLSGLLKTHPVGWLTIAGLEALDPAAFGIVALAHNDWSDMIARRFRAVASGWLDISSLNDDAVCRRARECGIDILIDLGGFGEGSRITACAHRLAPVQIKWVGMQSCTTGMPDIDWMLTDRWETPPELAHLYTEKLLVMPDGYICYSPPPYAPDAASLPAIANGHITFGCFNNLAKVTPRVIETWARVLHRVRGSRMVLKTHQFTDAGTRNRVGAAFAGHGIAAGRLELRGPSDHRTFIGEYNDIDIVLDPFPYSGGLTTCEALWMGVPTVALAGEIFAARHSVSHLSNAGLADWVASTIDAYVELAVAKASDIAALAGLRAGLRTQVRSSPLCDGPRFGHNLGAALRSAWRDWCGHAAHR